jgi:hypothetical protein
VVGLCARETRGRERCGPKTRNRAAVARLRAETGLHVVEGGAVGLRDPSRANLAIGSGMGGEVVWWVVVLFVLTWHPFCFSSFPPTPLPYLPTPSPPYSPLTSCVTVVRGRLRGCSGREECVHLSRLAEFQTPTIFDRDFEFHRSIFYRPPKIVKIIMYILYIYKNVYGILFQAIHICGLVYMVISFQSYKISIYIENTRRF